MRVLFLVIIILIYTFNTSRLVQVRFECVFACVIFCKYPCCDVIMLVAMTHDELPACLRILKVLIAAQLDWNRLGW